jgi:diguanylate cyclase (GGDEF)-like protein
MARLNPLPTRAFTVADALPVEDSSSSERVRHGDLRSHALAQRGYAKPANAQISPRSPDDALLALAVTSEHLHGAQRENEALRKTNEQLLQRLADASRRVMAAQRLAHHDGLTGLPNRLLLIKRLQQVLADAHRQKRQLALLFIDIDGFKAVNDRFGHIVGDRLLTIIAARIANCVRADDIACRYGGDEFVALLTNISDPAIAVGIADKIREHLDRRYRVDGQEVRVTASIGLAVYPADGDRYDELLRHADAAMYRSKGARRAQSAPSEISGPVGAPHRKRLAKA